MSEIITLSHGDGGALTHGLVKDVFLRHFKSEYLTPLTDAVCIDPANNKIVVSTDSHVVSPVFFPGGDIGKLAVCGTVNDVAVSGGIPRFLTAAFILEEGLELADLDRVVASMASTAREAGVQIVAGDTKVVEKNHGDKIFINTTGVGFLREGIDLGYHAVTPGDKIIINGTVGDHGLVIMAKRQSLGLKMSTESDCAPLNGIIAGLMERFDGIKLMRDATRGGLATTLKEIADFTQADFWLQEEAVPLREEVKSVASMLGLDPLYLANEGKFISIVAATQAEEFVSHMRNNPLGKDAEIIGEVKEGKGRVCLQTFFGGTKYLSYMAGAPLPRIC